MGRLRDREARNVQALGGPALNSPQLLKQQAQCGVWQRDWPGETLRRALRELSTVAVCLSGWEH